MVPVQFVLLHDVILQWGVDVDLFLRRSLAALPALFLIKFGTSSSTSAAAAVHVVVGQAGLDELGGGVGRRLTARTHETAVLQVGAVEGLHLVDLVGEVHVTIKARVRSQKVAGLVVHLVAVVGDAVGWAAVGGQVAVAVSVAAGAAVDGAVIVIGAVVRPCVCKPRLGS